MTREEAIDFLKQEKFKNVNSKYRRDWNDASDMAIEALSAEAVDVVRCKDCRWYRDTFFDTKITPTCDRHIDDRYGTLVGGITESSFCSYGERREP